jgi:uncharacterized protein with von Willebrand factor type A (vWA) domain
VLIHYSRWDGSQDLPDLDADDALAAMADDLLAHGDPRRALARLLRRGPRQADHRRLPGLQDLVDRLRQRRQHALDRYDLDSPLEDIRRKLDEIVRTERAGIEERLTGQAAARRRDVLDRLPPDPAGRIRALQDYDFADPEARRQFEALLQSLRQQALQPFLRGVEQALQNLTPSDLARLRELLQDLNRLLRERAEGGEPDFRAFRDRWGDHFPGAESLDELVERLRAQTAQMQSLLASMSAGQRAQLEGLLRALMLQDERLEAALAQLAMHLDALAPPDGLRREHDFRGDQALTLGEALHLMDELQALERLEEDLRRAERPEDLAALDPARVERLLGAEAARDLDRLRELARKLEEAGYLEQRGDRLALTPRAVRKLADRALAEIFARLARDRFGRHPLQRRGAGGDPADETKTYEYGDPFLLDLRETVMRAVGRQGAGIPVRLDPGDFAVVRVEAAVRAATVVMLDMSRSMVNNGLFLPAKKVALALHALIQGQFPRDRLHVVGFSLYAREFRAEQLPELTWSDWNVGTNMHAGFLLARQLLARDRGGNRQIILITDGEPTAHLEGEEAEFFYPTTSRTLQLTLDEVRRCTRESITINTFMLEQSAALTAFVRDMARINRGRAFFATPDRLGQYVLLDYVRGRRRTVS